MSLIVFLIIRLLSLTLAFTIFSPTVIIFCSTAMPQVILKFFAISRFRKTGLIRRNVYLPSKINLIRSYLLTFLILFELVPIYHLTSQRERVPGLLLRLLFCQLDVHVAIRMIFIRHLQSFVVLILEDFFQKGRFDALR
jgi:hypothetical protein